jgi:hypothetical protein
LASLSKTYVVIGMYWARLAEPSGFEARQFWPWADVLISSRTDPRELPMLDLIMLAIGLGFFALGLGYVYACDRL